MRVQSPGGVLAAAVSRCRCCRASRPLKWSPSRWDGRRRLGHVRAEDDDEKEPGLLLARHSRKLPVAAGTRQAVRHERHRRADRAGGARGGRSAAAPHRRARRVRAGGRCVAHRRARRRRARGEPRRRRRGGRTARRGSARPPAARRRTPHVDRRAARARCRSSRRSSARSTAWTLENGLRVSVRRIPIGAVGANFEARPNVAVDVAGQLLKSLQRRGAPHRRRSAAHGHGARRRGAASRARRSRACRPVPSGSCGRPIARERASSSSLPRVAAARDPARQRRDDGRARATGGGARSAHARARRGRRRPLYARGGRSREGASARRGEPRPARRVQPAQPAARRPVVPARRPARRARTGGRRVREPERLGHEWANDPEHIASVTVHVVDALEEAVALANEETSGLAAAIVTEDADAARAVPRRATAARPRSGTRRRASPTASRSPARPRPGSTSTACPGPRGPVTYRDLWLRQYRVVGDGTQQR